MELIQDWRQLQRTFYPVRRDAVVADSPIHIVEDSGVALAVEAEGEDLSSWKGMTTAEIRAQYPNRPVLSVSQADLDRWVGESLSSAHLPAQVDSLRQSWKSVSPEASPSLSGRLHFLIDALERSWWNRVLPSSYGLLIRLEGEQGRTEDFLLVYRKGELEQFGEPDLGFLGSERRSDLAGVGRYLAERIGVPVQSVLMSSEDWKRWSEQAHPWKEIAWAIQSKRRSLAPFRWQWVALIATRGFIGL